MLGRPNALEKKSSSRSRPFCDRFSTRHKHLMGGYWWAIIASLLITTSSAWAAQVTLAWDANTPAPDGYRLYRRPQNQAYNYSQPVWSGGATTCTLTDLGNATQYYFVVRAYSGTIESGDSNEIGYRTPAAGTTPTPTATPRPTATPTPAPNQAPIAEAGDNQTASSGQKVTLNGTKSYDPEAQSIAYRWVQTGGTSVSLSAATIAKPTFTAPSVATGQSSTLIFELTVIDTQSLSAADTCLVQVLGAPSADRDGDGVPDDQDAYPDDAAQWEQNQPPSQPTITYPANGATSVDLTPVLYSSAFLDANAGDTHKKSQWRIVSTKTKKTVLDVTRSDYFLTYFRVPLLVLRKNTEYACQVRFFDSHGLASEWSPTSVFTTRSSLYSRSGTLSEGQSDLSATDLNANGLSDEQETETMLRSLAYDEQNILALSIEQTGEQIVSMDALVSMDPNTEVPRPPVKDIGPYGLISYCIQVPQAGQEASVRLFFSAPIDPLAAWIQQGSDGKWRNGGEQIVPQPDGTSAIRRLKDGGENDIDGVANGIIIEKVALRETASSATQEDTTSNAAVDTDNSSGSDSSSAGSCFITSLLQ